jgi:hypothetical protein
VGLTRLQRLAPVYLLQVLELLLLLGFLHPPLELLPFPLRNIVELARFLADLSLRPFVDGQLVLLLVGDFSLDLLPEFLLVGDHDAE